MIDFNKLVEKHLEREFRMKKIGRYYPSEIGGCLRKTWFSYKKPKPTDIRLMKIFEAGNMLHKFITDVIKSEKNRNIELIKEEMPIEIRMKDFIISGRIDDLILVKICEDNSCKQILVEVKSTKYLPKEFKKEHEMQLQLYMRAIGIEEGLILYIQKDNLDTIGFPIIYNAEKGDKIIQRFEELHKSLAENQMPEAEAKLNEDMQWMCQYCPWKEECDKYKDGSI